MAIELPKRITKLDAVRILEKLELPPSLKAMAGMAILGMNDESLNQIFGMAQGAMEALKSGNKEEARRILVEAGMPEDVVSTILEKVKFDAPTTATDTD